MRKTLELVEASWLILRREKQLLLLPVLSTLAILLTLAGAAAGFASMGTHQRADVDIGGFTLYHVLSGHVGGIRLSDVLFGLACYLALVSSAIFFNAVLVAAVHERMEGREASLRRALRQVLGKLPALLAWAAFSMTVGLFINYLSSSNNLVMKVVGLVLSFAWAFMTFFVVPVLVVEGIGPREAVRRSTSLLEATWGKQLRARVGFSLAYLVVLIPLLVPCFHAANGAPWGIVVTTLILVAPLSIVGMLVIGAMEGIFTTALYRYASSGDLSPDFPAQFIREAYGPSGNGSGASFSGADAASNRDPRDFDPRGHDPARHRLF